MYFCAEIISMFIKQLYTNCLSEAAYYIESEGEAAVIDPIRDIDVYLQLAAERKASIRYIFETHFHADFVSGHIELSKACKAPIVFGPNTVTAFPVIEAKHEQEFKIGKLTIRALHTPGHTLESTCYLLKDDEGKDHALFSGDTLFVGDVGRPDLSSGDLSKEELAGMLYDSLQNTVMPLNDDVIVYPAHGPGSSCGKNIGDETFSTLGEQRKSNYALQQPTKNDFIKAVTDGLDEPPEYFPVNARINQQGYESLDKILSLGLTPLSIKTLKKKLDDDVIILDTRPTALFVQGFVPGSISISLEGRFAEWAGNLLPFDEPVLLITEKGKERETIIRLARVGFSKFEGYLQGGFEAWQNAGETADIIIDVEADELAMDMRFDKNLVVVDVRKEVEFADGHVKGAVNIPLEDMRYVASMGEINEKDNLYLHCASGYRSIIAASLLKKEGIHNVRNVSGGWDTIKKQSRIQTEKDVTVLN